jgi:hypothetical protein
MLCLARGQIVYERIRGLSSSEWQLSLDDLIAWEASMECSCWETDCSSDVTITLDALLLIPGLERRGDPRDHLTAKALQIYIESQASSLPHPVGSTVIYPSPRISANNLDIVIRFLATNGVCGFIVNGTLCRKGCCSPCRETTNVRNLTGWNKFLLFCLLDEIAILLMWEGRDGFLWKVWQYQRGRHSPPGQMYSVHVFAGLLF